MQEWYNENEDEVWHFASSSFSSSFSFVRFVESTEEDEAEKAFEGGRSMFEDDK